MDRGAWRATAHGATELDMTEQPALLHSFFLNSNFIKIKDKGHLQPKKKKMFSTAALVSNEKS